jgi:hypothetical protein
LIISCNASCSFFCINNKYKENNKKINKTLQFNKNVLNFKWLNLFGIYTFTLFLEIPEFTYSFYTAAEFELLNYVFTFNIRLNELILKLITPGNFIAFLSLGK